MRTYPPSGFLPRRARACALAALLAAGCSREPAPVPVSRAAPLAVNVLADTGRGPSYAVRIPPRALVWLASVTPARAPVPSPMPSVPLPDSEPPAAEAAPELEVDPGLKPPVLRTPASLTLPPGHARGRVELDVHVDESGTVSEVLWAAGSEDSVLVGAARRCALGMRFYPALRAGRPVAVWCRQHFDFGSGRP